MSASTHGDWGPRRDATGAATASVTVRSDRATSRGVEFIDGSLMFEPYELRAIATDLRHQAARIRCRCSVARRQRDADVGGSCLAAGRRASMSRHDGGPHY